jgi:hypothetical protein
MGSCSRFKFSIIACFLGVLISAPSVLAHGIPWSPFYWNPMTYNGVTYKKSALMIPVRIRNYPETYCMQLDTGYQDTIFYAVPKSIKKELIGNYHEGEPFYLAMHYGSTLIHQSGIKIKYAPKAEMDAPCPVIGTVG